ncbi:hypothetical protein [Actinomadura macrotermitis]|uniref:Uncharacterized protein n=1 Tax=Actinomadura macrotermitis TaxID=2585200 RepID=A0A7K0C5Q5_9ACTN|nr:hypothetical protein [Actinomadura macrotermitis]MQY08763.1 hypothetical protein [Actinomadura macrotermitis]
MTSQELFDHVGEVVRGSTPPALGALHLRVHGRGIKAWLGGPEPAREHYEAQLIGADLVAGAAAQALEIGFHAEHRQEADNEAVLVRLRAAEGVWRGALGLEPVAGAFLGRDGWRRVSEVWPDPDLRGADVAFEIGVRLMEYMRALEPHRAPVAGRSV